MKVGIIGSVIVWVAIAWVVSGCEYRTAFLYQGKSGFDYRNQTDIEQESVTDSQATKRGR